MAHPYTTEERVKRLDSRTAKLLDRNQDGIQDTDGTVTTIADAIERACNRLDGAVMQVYVIPLTVDLSVPATAGLVADLADQLALALLYKDIEGHDSAAAAALEQSALDDLDLVRARRTGLPGQTALATVAGRTGVRYESGGVYVAGGITDERTDNPYTDDTVDQTRGM